MPVIGNPRSYHKKFKFVMEIDGFNGQVGFNKCSELSVEVAKVEYREGGALIPDKSPGLVNFSDITLERGATRDQKMFDWFVEVADAAANSGLTDPNYKRMAELAQQDRDGSTLRKWRIFNAWPVKFVAGEWDNEADENNIEMTTLTYDTFDLDNREGSA
jgi:phage tail-like protein